jgi:hypothetical protein
MSMLETLVGTNLTGVIRIHDYVQLLFQDGTILSVFNPLTVLKSETDTAIENCIGRKVLLAINNEDLETVQMELEGEIIIRVDLRHQSYRVPEAMVLSRPGKPIVVWSGH